MPDLLTGQPNFLKKDILPVLYVETKKRQDLVVITDYGAFKEKVDQHLPLRHAGTPRFFYFFYFNFSSAFFCSKVFECLGTILKESHHSLNLKEFLEYLQQGYFLLLI